MSSKPDAQQTGLEMDLLDAMIQAVRFTCAFDLHFCDRHDAQLSRGAEALDELLQEHRPLWPQKLPPHAPDQPIRNAIRDELLTTLHSLGDRAEDLARRVGEREPQDRQRDEPGSASRCQQKLVALWNRLAFLCQQRVSSQPLDGGIPDAKTTRLLNDVGQALPSTVFVGTGPTSFLRELYQPGERHTDPDVFDRLVERIARTWKIDVGDRGADFHISKALSRFALDEGLDRADAKLRLIEGALADVLCRLHHPIAVQVGKAGQQYRKRVNAPVRVTQDGENSETGTHQWASRVAARATPRMGSFWVEEVPFYRRWKWVVNKSIAHAEDVLKVLYPMNEVTLSDARAESAPYSPAAADATPGPFTRNDTAQIEARLLVEERLEAVGSANLTPRQAEVWIRRTELPPNVRHDLAARFSVEVPASKQTRQEVADDLGIAPGTVASHRNRAHQKVKQAADVA